jgi:hypothetical protein
VERFVGEGAKKRVYRARDTRLDRDVAIALVKAEGLDEGARARVRREAQAMGRLGDHPHIVTVHDISEEDGQLYIVSQFMSGGDVAGLVSDADGGRVLIDRALEIADQVCGALEHAHSRGIIHRDVKPGNIWLAENGTAMLGDFGLALALDQSRLTQEGSMVGTPAYLPPEQALGRSPDARSDLYALGAVLYELVCGRPPFLGDDAVSIISQHINTPPVAPSWHNAEVSKPLEALILRLLEKDPAARPASAREVSEAFRALGRASATPPDTLERAEANPLDRLAGGIFVGREAEVHTLRGGLDDALSGRGRILMLVGEPGIGKTRSSEELATYAGMRGAQVLWGRCYEGDGAPAYWPWVQILRAYVHDREPSELMQDMGPGAADIAEVVSEVRERLPGLPAPPPLDPEQARFSSPRFGCWWWAPIATSSWGGSTRSSRRWRSWPAVSSRSASCCGVSPQRTSRASSSSLRGEPRHLPWPTRCTARPRAIPSSCTRSCACSSRTGASRTWRTCRRGASRFRRACDR